MGTIPAYNLQLVSDDNCWKLFASHVFNGIDFEVHQDLQEMGKQIVKKCRGLPLAVKSIAGILRSLSSPEEWKGLLESDVWELQFQENQKNKILPALWLSYQFLPPQLKGCFAYRSIFPKDYEFKEFDQEILVMLWMADGFLQPNREKRMEDVGREYLDGLIARSFFRRSSRGGRPILLMHDLIHDLAMHISGEFSFVSDGCFYLDDITSKTRYLSYKKGSKGMIKFDSLSKAKCLSTLLALPLPLEYGFKSILTDTIVSELLLKVGGCFKVLSLSQSNIVELATNPIGDQKYLKYLDLSFTKVKELPSSIGTLYNLQALLLSKCKNLTRLPMNLYRLINLRHLVISSTPLKEMPPQMCKLRNLQTLSDFVISENGGSRIKELGELHSLHGSLCISGLENVVEVGDVFEADLKNKKYLTELILRWKHGKLSDDSIKEREVLNVGIKIRNAAEAMDRRQTKIF